MCNLARWGIQYVRYNELLQLERQDKKTNDSLNTNTS